MQAANATSTANPANPSGRRPIKRFTKAELDAMDAKCIAFNERPQTFPAKAMALKHLAAGIMPPDTELCDLDNDVHPLFHRSQWKPLSEESYKRILPALRMASHVITQTATKSFFAKLSCSDILYDVSGSAYLRTNADTYTESSLAFVDEIFKVLPSRTQLRFAELDAAGWTFIFFVPAQVLDRSVNGEEIVWDATEGLVDVGALPSLPTSADGNMVYRVIPEQEISIPQSQQTMRLVNRCFMITLDNDLLEPFLDNVPGRYENSPPAKRLSDLFHLAITLVHEVVHAYVRIVRDWPREPWYGRGWKFGEVGLAWEKWMFGGTPRVYYHESLPIGPSPFTYAVEVGDGEADPQGRFINTPPVFIRCSDQRVLSLGYMHAWFQKATWDELEKRGSVIFMRKEAYRLFLSRFGQGFLSNWEGFHGYVVMLDGKRVGKAFYISDPDISLLHGPWVNIWEKTKDPGKRAKEKRVQRIRNLIAQELEIQRQIQVDVDAEDRDAHGQPANEGQGMREEGEGSGQEQRRRSKSSKKRKVRKVRGGRVGKTRSPARGRPQPQPQPAGPLNRLWGWIRGFNSMPDNLRGGGMAELLPK